MKKYFIIITVLLGGLLLYAKQEQNDRMEKESSFVGTTGKIDSSKVIENF